MLISEKQALFSQNHILQDNYPISVIGTKYPSYKRFVLFLTLKEDSLIVKTATATKSTL